MVQRNIAHNLNQYLKDMQDTEWLDCCGVIRYDPYRPGLKTKNKWWAVLEVHGSIDGYYRWFLKKEYGLDLCQPSWKAHVSIIRGEKPKDDLMHLWKKWEGTKINFKYQPFIRYNGDTKDLQFHSNGEFWFLNIDAPQLTNIRNELQLPSDWQLHMTIGRKWNHEEK